MMTNKVSTEIARMELARCSAIVVEKDLWVAVILQNGKSWGMAWRCQEKSITLPTK